MKKILLAYIFLSFSFCSIGQKSFDLTVNIDKNIDGNKLRLYYENGANDIYVTDSFKNNSLSIKGKYYSKYVTVHLAYDEYSSNPYLYNVWITDKKAIINLKGKPGGTLLDNSILVNAIDIDRENKKLSDSLKNYTISELNNMSALWAKSDQYKNRSTFDSLQRNIFISMMNKSSEYIKKHNDNYFYFWYFIDQYYKGSKTIFQRDTLLRILIRDSLISIFPKKFISSFEGNKILQEIEVFLRPKINIPSPLFQVSDIGGNIIDIKRYEGKYVLLDFWASWCPPCMGSMPVLKEIHKKYSPDKLAVIGINSDRDSTAFTKAVSNLQLNWTQVFDKENVMMNLFGETVLPTWILINKEGIIIFNESGSDKTDRLLNLLDSL